MADKHVDLSLGNMGEADDDILAGKIDRAQVYLLAAQAHATLALVEAAERLAEAQETANLIARQKWVLDLPPGAYEKMDRHARTQVERAGNDIDRRLKGYLDAAE